MGGPSGGYDWLSLLLVGVPGTLLAAITLAVVLLDRARSTGSKNGQEAADIEAMGRRMDSIGEGLAGQGAALQEHLIGCAKSHGRVEQVLVSLKEGQERGERQIAELQRTVANWMRDKERSAP